MVVLILVTNGRLVKAHFEVGVLNTILYRMTNTTLQSEQSDIKNKFVF